MPLNAARFCLQFAGIEARDVDVVAFPYAPIGLDTPARWHYAKRHWYAPDRALDALFNGNRRYRRNRGRVLVMGTALGIDWTKKVANTPSGREFIYVDSVNLGGAAMMHSDEIGTLFE